MRGYFPGALREMRPAAPFTLSFAGNLDRTETR